MADSISVALEFLSQAMREVQQVELVSETEDFDVATDPRGIEACIVAMRRIREAQSALRTLSQTRETRALVKLLEPKP